MLALGVRDLEVRFPGLAAPALAIDTLDLAAGAHVAVTGASGSGKTTLVHLLAGLERTRHGSIRWGDTDLATLGEGARDRWRAAKVGLVMQDFHLIPGLSALANVLLPQTLARLTVPAALKERARWLIDRVDVTRPQQRVDTMSRGEMQRVAVARALLAQPAILVADEPTASLDPHAGAKVGELLVEMAREAGTTLIVATHDAELVSRLDIHWRLAAGRLSEG